MPAPHTDNLRHLAEEFGLQLSNVFFASTRQRFSVSAALTGASHPSSTFLIWEQPFTGVDHGRAWICASEPAVNVAGGAILTSAGVADPDPSSAKSTFLEAAIRAFESFAPALGSKLSKEISAAPGEESGQPGELDWVALSFPLGERQVVVEIGFDPRFAAQFHAAETALIPSGGAPATLDLLLDVELPVSVSFGRAQLPLKDVIKLTTGSIVELNRTVSEPVDVIVNNCVIARGEVVVVEGNFGVRIHEVMSRRERMRTMM